MSLHLRRADPSALLAHPLKERASLRGEPLDGSLAALWLGQRRDEELDAIVFLRGYVAEAEGAGHFEEHVAIDLREALTKPDPVAHRQLGDDGRVGREEAVFEALVVVGQCPQLEIAKVSVAEV